jgi:hypothetical protein
MSYLGKCGIGLSRDSAAWSHLVVCGGTVEYSKKESYAFDRKRIPTDPFIEAYYVKN